MERDVRLLSDVCLGSPYERKRKEVTTVGEIVEGRECDLALKE